MFLVRVRPFTSHEAGHLQIDPQDSTFMGDGSLATSSTSLFPLSRFSMGSNVGIKNVINVVDDKMLIFDPPDNHLHCTTTNRVAYGANTKRAREHRFVFDRVFDISATQNEVYSNTTRPLLDSVLDGYNATVFAYGATGCGKTHTITGTKEEPGIIFLTMKELFERIDELRDEMHVELSLSYLEIYNESIRDLLDPNTRKPLLLREDAFKHISVSNLSVHEPQNVQDVMDMIISGNQNRTMSPTEANATSSRSHAVLQINVSQKSRTASLSEAHTFATLSVIDLAGSERASATKNRGERLIEGANINKSLLALGNCINALCDHRRRNHIPYRDSKLTRLLKFSLGGNCKTVMIVCISPSSKHYDETLNTLKYADRAKKIKTKVIRNQHNLNRHVGSYLKVINEQKQEIEELKAREGKSNEILLENLKKVEEKCYTAINSELDTLRQAISNCQKQRENRIYTTAKLKFLISQISQIEETCNSHLQSDSSAEQIPLENIIPQCIDKLLQKRNQIQNFLDSLENVNGNMVNLQGIPLTPTRIGNSRTDRAIINSTISHLLRVLQDTRGWSHKHTDYFQAQANCICLEAENASVKKILDLFTSSPSSLITLRLLVQKVPKIIGNMYLANRDYSKSEQDSPNINVVELFDEIITQIQSIFDKITNGTNTLEFTNTSGGVFSTPLRTLSPTKKEITKSPFSANLSSSSSPTKSRTTVNSSLVNPHKSPGANNGYTLSLKPNTMQNFAESPFRQINKQNFVFSNHSSPLRTPQPSSVSSVAFSYSPHQQNTPKLPSLRAGHRIPGVLKKHKSTGSKNGTFPISPAKNTRKSVKRVKWEDTNDDVDEYKEINHNSHPENLIQNHESSTINRNNDGQKETKETNSFGDSTTFFSAMESDSINSSVLIPSQLARLGLSNEPVIKNQSIALDEKRYISSPKSTLIRAPSSTAQMNAVYLNTPNSSPRISKSDSLGGTLKPVRKNSFVIGKSADGYSEGIHIFSNTNTSVNTDRSSEESDSFSNHSILSKPLPLLVSNTNSSIPCAANRSVTLPLKKSAIQQFLFNNETVFDNESTNPNRGEDDKAAMSLDNINHSPKNKTGMYGDNRISPSFDEGEDKVNTNTNIMSGGYSIDDMNDLHEDISNGSVLESFGSNSFSTLEPHNEEPKEYEKKVFHDTESSKITQSSNDLSFDPMDIDEKENSQTPLNVSKADFESKSDIPSLPNPSNGQDYCAPAASTNSTTTATKKSARPSFGVKADLRRKSSIVPMIVLAGTKQP